jgi:hypothetical protein
LAADKREAAPGDGARYSSTRVLTSSLPKGGQQDTNNWRTVAKGGAARSAGGGPKDQPPPEKPVRKVLNNFRTPAAFQIRQSRPCTTLPLPIIAMHTSYYIVRSRVSAEARTRDKATRVLDGGANGGWSARSLNGFQTCTRISD